ncbi:13877_t:CDS:2, partial [Gigaspora rosea]
MNGSDICDDFFEETSHETSDNVSSVSSNSGATSTTFSDQSRITKKNELNHPKFRRQYAKSSWVWKYFTLSKDKEYCICTVEIIKLSNKQVKCGHKLIYNGETPNFCHKESSDDDSDEDSDTESSVNREHLLNTQTLSTWDDETQKRAKSELARQFQELIASDLEKAMPTSNSSNIPNNNLHRSRFHSSIFGASATFNTTSNPLSELECYLDP